MTDDGDGYDDMMHLHGPAAVKQAVAGTQVASNTSKMPKGDVQPVQIMPRATPIRSQASLNKALNDAEGDDDIAAIKKRMNKRGYDTSNF